MPGKTSSIIAEVRDIKRFLIEISKKLDRLIYEKEMGSMMKLSESALLKLYESEPDIYKVSDIKVKYQCKE